MFERTKKTVTALDLQQRCHKRTCVCGGDAGGSWSSYSWGLPTAWLNTPDTPADANTAHLVHAPHGSIKIWACKV